MTSSGDVWFVVTTEFQKQIILWICKEGRKWVINYPGNFVWFLHARLPLKIERPTSYGWRNNLALRTLSLPSHYVDKGTQMWGKREPEGSQFFQKRKCSGRFHDGEWPRRLSTFLHLVSFRSEWPLSTPSLLSTVPRWEELKWNVSSQFPPGIAQRFVF